MSMPADRALGAPVNTCGLGDSGRRRAGRAGRALFFVVAALTGAFLAGCGGDDSTSNESLPPRPKLTVPDDSVEPRRQRDQETTGETGAADSGADSAVPQQNSGGQGTGGAAPQQQTGGQGTGQDQGTAVPPQDTGGAAPGQ